MRIALFVLLTLSTASHAAQVVVTEVTYTHSGTTTTDSHYMLQPLPGTPTNWVSPVNYSQGTAVVRLEVFTKPTNAATRFQICFTGSPNYACTNQAPAYTTTGVYTWTTPFPNFFQYSQMNWSQGANEIALILKDTNNGKPSPDNVGATEAARYMPTRLRVTVTLVSPGSTYVPPDSDAGTPMPDAGAVDAGAVDAGAPDAGSPAPLDAGVPEADAGTSPIDSGAPATPAEMLDAGGAPPEVAMPIDGDLDPRGCGCQSAPLGMLVFALMLLLRARVK